MFPGRKEKAMGTWKFADPFDKVLNAGSPH
jgi:hypothetical protein